MQSLKDFMESNANQTSQINSRGHAMPETTTSTFEAMSSKSDLFDTLKNNLQVSHSFNSLTYISVLYVTI